MTGSSRRKNKHPKRAENVKTVVVVRKGGDREEERDDDDVERLRRILMCVPCETLLWSKIIGCEKRKRLVLLKE